MNLKTIAAVSLSNADFPSLDAKLAEAARWIEFAAIQGAQLVVLPEFTNQYYGDGPDNPRQPRLEEIASDDWQKDTRILFDAAVKNRVALTIPVLIREGKRLSNCFFLVSRTGQVLGRYRKMRPTIAELEAGVEPGGASQPLIAWEGLKVGGAICFDTEYPEVFAEQAEAGAELFLVPSLWPGGRQLDFYAMQHGVSIVLAYPAWSRILDADGRELDSGGYRNETLRFGFGSPVICAGINFDRIILHGDGNAGKIVEMQRCYGSKLRMRFDQPNVTWMVESVDPELSIKEVISRFQLEARPKFLARARQAVMAVAR